MTRHRALLALLAAFAAAATSATLLTGHAASLGVRSARVDTFAASQAAPTTTTTTAPTTTTTTVPSDTTAPALTGLEMRDQNANGRVDQVVATFNEALAPYAAGTAPWTLANTPSGGTLASVAVSGSTATLTITEGGGAPNTAVGSFTVALAQSATGIRDAAGNRSSFTATGPADKAGPVPKTLTIANGGSTVGQPERADTVTVVWSERLLASSICGATFSDSSTQTATGNAADASIEITNGDAPTADTLTATFSCVLRFGSVSLGSSGFVPATRTFADNPAADRASATWNPSTATFTLKLGKPSGTAGTVSTAVTATYTPSTLLTDAAGNAAGGTVSVTAVLF